MLVQIFQMHFGTAVYRLSALLFIAFLLCKENSGNNSKNDCSIPTIILEHLGLLF